MKKVYSIVALVCVFFGFSTVETHAEGIETKNIFSITNPSWIFDAGMNKGKYHDRQDLGFILEADTEIRVRQTNKNFKDKLTLRLLGDDSDLEKSINVGTDWVTLKASVPLVPFVDTPYGSESAQIEYEIADSKTQKALPVYEYQKNEADFFSTWDKFDGNYALVKGKDFQLLIPKLDKEITRHLKDYKSLDELIEHYNDLFSYYNQIAGFDNSTKENQNGENRYFLKADKHGAGGAYYGDEWTANSYGTVDMWLTKNNWGTLHEIAHGYQAGFDNVGMYTGEVSNNLFAVQYSYDKYGKEADNIGWLFNFGKKEKEETNLYNKMIEQNGTYKSAGLREQLILLSLLKQKAGDDSFTKMYQEYRQLAAQPNFNKKNYPLPDLLNRIYSENSQQDFSPVLLKWGLELEESESEMHRILGYPGIASLADIVPKDRLAEARKLVDESYMINSNFEMVTNNEIASLNLNGNLTIQLGINDINDILGTNVVLKDGQKEIAAQEIKGKEITFENIPNGIYHLEFSGKNMVKYIPENVYVYVKEADNNTTIALDKVSKGNFINQKIELLGISDKLFATVKTDMNREKLIVSILNDTPHNYYGGEVYASVTVKNKDGQIKYTKNIEGTKVPLEKNEIPILEDDIIEIYHAEPKRRLVSEDTAINPSSKTNRWVVTKLGLKNTEIEVDLEKKLIERIDQRISLLQKNELTWKLPASQVNEKKEIQAAISQLSDALQLEYKTKYPELYIIEIAAEKLEVEQNPVRVPVGNGTGAKEWKPTAEELKKWVKNVKVDGVATDDYQVELTNPTTGIVPIDRPLKDYWTVTVKAKGLSQTLKVDYEVYEETAKTLEVEQNPVRVPVGNGTGAKEWKPTAEELKKWVKNVKVDGVATDDYQVQFANLATGKVPTDRPLKDYWTVTVKAKGLSKTLRVDYEVYKEAAKTLEVEQNPVRVPVGNGTGAKEWKPTAEELKKWVKNVKVDGVATDDYQVQFANLATGKVPTDRPLKDYWTVTVKAKGLSKTLRVDYEVYKEAAKTLEVEQNPVRVPVGNGTGAKEWKPTAEELKKWVKNVKVDGVATDDYQVELTNPTTGIVPIDRPLKDYWTVTVKAKELSQTLKVDYEVYEEAAKTLEVEQNPVRVPVGNGTGAKEWKPTAEELKKWVKNVKVDGIATDDYQVELTNPTTGIVPIDRPLNNYWWLVTVKAKGLSKQVIVDYEVYEVNDSKWWWW